MGVFSVDTHDRKGEFNEIDGTTEIRSGHDNKKKESERKKRK